jgi:hypothetical protein
MPDIEFSSAEVSQLHVRYDRMIRSYEHINALCGQHAEFLFQPVVYNLQLPLGFEWLRNYKERSQYDNYARDWTTEK